MCIIVHDIVSFGDQSARAEESRHQILVTKPNIWCATVMAKWVASILTKTFIPFFHLFRISTYLTHFSITNWKSQKEMLTRNRMIFW